MLKIVLKELKLKKYIITIIILFTIILLSIGGYFIYSNAKTNDANSVDKLKEKCLSELNFLSTQTIEIMNSLNNISYSNFEIVNKEVPTSENGGQNTVSTENSISSSVVEYNNILNEDSNDIDWNGISKIVENIYGSWTNILIDLTTMNVNKDNLLQYNTILDSIVTNIQDKDKVAALTNTADLYNLLYLYLKDFSGNEREISLFYIRSNILYAYSLASQQNWDKMREYINIAKQEFNNVLNNQVDNISNIDVINKAYILINELEDDINNKNESIFYINYKNLMQELEAI